MREALNQIVILAVSLLITATLVILGYWWYKKNKPQHTFVGLDFGAQSVQPRKIRNLFGPFKVKRNDGQKVIFPVPQGYAVPRQDGKGTLFFGDLATGQLMKPVRNGDQMDMDFAHGIFVEKALSDGRVQLVVSSTKPATGITLQHIAIGILIIVVLLGFNIYQYAHGRSVGH